jgi:outer membrane PBP1 activator LpoA protein
MMQLKRFAALQRYLAALPLALLVGLLSSCALLPPPVPQPTAPAAQAVPRGDHAALAAQYESSATGSRAASEQAELKLSAAREWLAAGRAVDAARVLASLRAMVLTGAQNEERLLLDAETSLVAQRAQEAWAKIAALPEPTATNAAARHYPLKMRIAMAAGRPVDAVRAEIAAERYAPGVTERAALRAQLLEALRDARERGIALDSQPTQDPVVRGWLELAAIAPTRGPGPALSADSQLASWRARYPGHPGLEILSREFPTPLAALAPGGRVALLLPLTGPATDQAATVRDGFLSAYYQLPAAGRPELQLIDTAALNGPAAIAQARAAGCNFIVGPLTRDDVAAVADTGAQSVPVLALNFLPTNRSAPNGMFQFALSPEEEAQQVARRLLADGHRRGIAVVPRDDWGSRVMDAFTHELLAGGGSLIGIATYDPASHDYGDALRNVLRVDDSTGRHERLQNVLGTKLNFEPRRRADIEFVFIAPPSATNARLIAPQLKFFYAGDIPSYSLSNAYEPDSTASNQDIDGLIYPDMPWMMSGDTGVDEIRNAVAQAWESRAAWRSRLFAFGYDACQLMLAMAAPGRNPADVRVAGLSGELHFDSARRVSRDLIWVQVRNGEPKRLNSAAAD